MSSRRAVSLRWMSPKDDSPLLWMTVKVDHVELGLPRSSACSAVQSMWKWLEGGPLVARCVSPMESKVLEAAVVPEAVYRKTAWPAEQGYVLWQVWGAA